MSCELSEVRNTGEPEPMHKMNPSMFCEQRNRLVQTFKSRNLSNGIILLKGGDQQSRHDTDVGPVFRQESYFFYLFGWDEPCEYGKNYYGAIDLASGACTFFIADFPQEFAVWMGPLKTPEEVKTAFGFDDVKHSTELVFWLNSIAANQALTIYILNGVNTDSGLRTVTIPSFLGEESLSKALVVDEKTLHPILARQRTIKTDMELDVMRYVCRVSSRAHVSVMRRCRPGWSQHHLESTFLHHVYFHGGCRHVSYTCICATGSDNAVLHYPHNNKPILDGQMALMDMGGEYHCYTSDITCSYPVNGKFTANQRLIYTAVLEAQKAVFRRLCPGVSWVEMHLLALRVICEHLRNANILTSGTWEEWCSVNIPPIFQPHGLGHLMGLDVHDVGGIPEEVERPKELNLSKLRNLRTLEKGMTLTVEPGCYFNRVLLEQALANPTQKAFLNEELIRKEFWDFGGVRLEDDIIITANGCENMTLCPREIEDVEAVMKSQCASANDEEIFNLYATKLQRFHTPN